MKCKEKNFKRKNKSIKELSKSHNKNLMILKQ